jgi:GntR family transcriptional regulator, vanillate catabolism transcriptional regulator
LPFQSEVSQTGRAILQLREMLLRGDFQPGERLSELALVARLGASRTPIRLALDRLAQEGLVEPVPSGGFTVAEFTLDDIWDTIELRGVLEGTAARLAAERLYDSRELRPIRALQTEMDAIDHPNIDSFTQYMDLNEQFHANLVQLAKSPMLSKAIQRAIALPFASPSALVFARAKLPNASQMIAIGQEQHHAILEAIERRHGTRAESVAREHALLARRNLEIVLSDQAVLNHVPGAPLIRL